VELVVLVVKREQQQEEPVEAVEQAGPANY
jgi:hypothetical protein